MIGRIFYLAGLFTVTLFMAVASASYSFSRFAPSPIILPAAFGSGIAPLRYIDRISPLNLETDYRSQQLDRLAIRSLETQAVNPKAVRVLAITARNEGDYITANRLAHISETLSRRDGLTQLLIIDGLGRSAASIDQLIAHFDTALRVNPEIGPQLYPLMANLSSNQQFQTAIAPYVKERVHWTEGLLLTTLNIKGSSRSVADVIIKAQPTGALMLSKSLSEALFKALVRDRELSLSRVLYSRLPDAPISVLESAEFRQMNDGGLYGPLAWQFNNSADVGATIYEKNKDNSYKIQVYAESGASGTPLQKVLFLKPGTYQLTYSSKSLEGSKNANVNWTVKCIGESSKELFQSSNFANVDESMKKSSSFTIDCKNQILELNVFGGDSQFGTELVLEKLKFIKL